ncbi:MAG: ankyrin repeat domain-containing protein [Pseudomonadota bacterium]
MAIHRLIIRRFCKNSNSLWLAMAFTSTLAAQPVTVETDTRLADAAMARDMQTVRTLLQEKGGDVNALGEYDTPALHWVVRVEDTAVAAELLEAGADPNIANGYGITPLHLAIENADVEMVKLLLDAGADPLTRDRAGESALFLAARSRSVGIVDALLKHGAAVDEHEPNFDQTPLMIAVRASSADIVSLLIEHGADVNVQTKSGPVPEMRLPASNAGSKGIGIVRGGWPERGERSPVGGAKTPLLYSTRQGDLALTRLLVEAGADIEQPDANGVTPLLNAIVNASVGNSGEGAGQNIAAALYLIEQGAETNVQDWYGESPLWTAVSVRNLDVNGPTRDNGVDREAMLGLITVLLDEGADVNVRTKEQPPERRFIMRIGDLSWVDFTGQTPFIRAALSGDLDVMNLLLEHGADPNITTFAGTNALMAAAGMNWVVNQTWDAGPEALLAAVKLAHELGNDINAVNSMGLNAVHAAANRGSDDIIRYLAEQGAVLDLADKEGRTPIVWAQGVFLATHPPVNRPETVALLEQLQATRELVKE